MRYHSYYYASIEKKKQKIKIDQRTNKTGATSLVVPNIQSSSIGIDWNTDLSRD